MMGYQSWTVEIINMKGLAYCNWLTLHQKLVEESEELEMLRTRLQSMETVLRSAQQCEAHKAKGDAQTVKG